MTAAAAEVQEDTAAEAEASDDRIYNLIAPWHGELICWEEPAGCEIKSAIVWRFDPEPDLDNANVGMSEKILQKSCRQKKQAASKKDIACFLFHVERSLNWWLIFFCNFGAHNIDSFLFQK